LARPLGEEDLGTMGLRSSGAEGGVGLGGVDADTAVIGHGTTFFRGFFDI